MATTRALYQRRIDGKRSKSAWVTISCISIITLMCCASTTLITASSGSSKHTTVTKETLGSIKEKIQSVYFPSSSKEVDMCRWYDVGAALKTVTENEAMLGDSIVIDGEKIPVMVQTNCFEKGSLGNQLSNYFEARICAQLSGVHYLSLSHMVGDDAKQPHPFFKGLPALVQHLSPVNSMKMAKQNVKNYCTCGSICHGKCSSGT